MNIDFGDVDNDGWLDAYVTNITTESYLQEGNMLWYNQGPGADGELTMTDISWETGTHNGGWGWGGKFFDHDNDGDLDIVTVNGFISAGEGNYWYDLASWTVLGEDSSDARNWPAIGKRSFSGYEPTRVWRNDGFYTFVEEASDLGLASTRDGRGIVSFDYDNDGDLDLFIANQGQEPHLFRNGLRSSNHWLVVDLETDPRDPHQPRWHRRPRLPAHRLRSDRSGAGRWQRLRRSERSSDALRPGHRADRSLARGSLAGRGGDSTSRMSRRVKS